MKPLGYMATNRNFPPLHLKTARLNWRGWCPINLEEGLSVRLLIRTTQSLSLTNDKKATHLVLCLFPFELEVYQRHNHPAVCVGHPLLHNLPKELVEIATHEQRRELIWNNSELHNFFANRKEDISQMICLMPGSRRSEINAILPLMLNAVNRLLMVD